MERVEIAKTTEEWAQQASAAIDDHKMNDGRLEVALGIAAYIDDAVRTGASGPFAFWSRAQILAMKCSELVSELSSHIDHESIRMHLAGSFVHALRKSMQDASSAGYHASSEQIVWTINFFEVAEASPDYTFVAGTGNEMRWDDACRTRTARAAYCDVLLDNIVWNLNRCKAA